MKNWKNILLVILIMMLLVTVPLLGEIDLRYLGGGYWKYLSEDERFAFVRGFIMGSVATQASIEAGQWSRLYSLVDVYDRELSSALSEYYYSGPRDETPLIVLIFEMVKAQREEDQRSIF